MRSSMSAIRTINDQYLVTDHKPEQERDATRAAGMDTYKTDYFLDVRVDIMDRHTAHEIVRNFINDDSAFGSRTVFFTNVHSIHLARHDREFKEYIDRADLVLPDGSGLKIAGNLLDKPIMDNLNGTDFTPEIFEMARHHGWSVFLFGARKDVVERCRTRIDENFPGLQVKGIHHGYIKDTEEEMVIETINRTRPDIVLVALGSPRQEKWITTNAGRLNAKVCLAVGGLFDFIAGEKRRAPRWMRQMGIEWLHRFLISPRDKWYRIIVEIPWFLYRVLAIRIRMKNRHLPHKQIQFKSIKP